MPTASSPLPELSPARAEGVSSLKGGWIAPAGCASEKNFHFRVRKKFELDEVPLQAVLRIGCESTYVVYLNGHEIGRGPARGTHTVNFSDRYPITEFLQSGENILAAVCQCMNIETFIAAPAEPAFFAEIEDVAVTNTSWETLGSGQEWKRETPLESEQTGFSEWRDLRHEPVGWTTGRDHGDWQPAELLASSSKVLGKAFRDRGIPLLRETEILPCAIAAQTAVTNLAMADLDEAAAQVMKDEHQSGAPVLELHDGLLSWSANSSDAPTGPWSAAYIVDFGRVIVGRLELVLSGEEGTLVDVAYAEDITAGRLVVQHRDLNGGRYHFADRYILREGPQTVGTCLSERGFRYVQITFRNCTQQPKLHGLRAVDRRYPYVPAAEFSCSDAELDVLWTACAQTLATCTTDTLIDCPWRERALWVNDLLVESTVSLQLFGDARICRRTLDVAFSETLASGLVPGVVPCPADRESEDWLALLSANLFLFPVVHQYLLHTGDEQTVRGCVPKLTAILQHFETYRNSAGLIAPPEKYWSFFDWSYEANGHSLNGHASAPLNYLFLLARKTLSELQGLLGYEREQRLLAEAVRRDVPVVEAAFFDRKNQRLLDFGADSDNVLSSQLSHALAVLVGATSPKRQALFVQRMQDHDLLAPELFLHAFLFDALEISGGAATGLERIRQYWTGISQQSATIWEFGVHGQGKSALGGIGSLCHGFATAPVSFLGKTILGVRPLESGFRKFSIHPCDGGLDYAAGEVPTPAGKVGVRWKKSGPALQVALRVPPGCEAVAADGRIFAEGRHEFLVEARS